MNLYKISQTVNNGYDTYSDAVVVANSEQEAQRIYPGSVGLEFNDDPDSDNNWRWLHNWAAPFDVQVLYIGTASIEYTEPTIIVDSFHAG